MPWVRPQNVPSGQIWSRFKGRERDGKPACMYQIRDMDIKKKEVYIDFMLETFLRDEPLCKVLNIKSDPTSIKSILENWHEYLDQNVSLACYVEDADGNPKEMVAFNTITIKQIDDLEETFEHVDGKPWHDLVKTLVTAENLVDIFKHYGVDTYMSSSGLTVLPEHRGQNLGARMFEARKPLCKALGIRVVSTVFTATTSQVLAAKCGYEELAVLRYKDMVEFGVNLDGVESPVAKVMGIKYDF